MECKYIILYFFNTLGFFLINILSLDTKHVVFPKVTDLYRYGHGNFEFLDDDFDPYASDEEEKPKKSE